MTHQLGIDLGSAAVRLVLLEDDQPIIWKEETHHGDFKNTLLSELRYIKKHVKGDSVAISATGSNSRLLIELFSEMAYLGDIPAIATGTKRLHPDAGSVIEIGCQGARFITDLDENVPQFAANEHCAGGTGSFFEDQMSRLGMKIQDYSSLVAQANTMPRLSGRCAVFAKTDIIHRQQEGVSTPDILLGLCFAMIRNYKATIVRNLPLRKPIAFCGGVTKNIGVARAILDIFNLTDDTLLIDEHAAFAAALGAAAHAEVPMSVQTMIDTLSQDSLGGNLEEALPVLVLEDGTNLTIPDPSETIPPDGCAMGIDIGSTSTDIILIGRDGNILDYQYLRTAGNPERAVRSGFATLQKKYGNIDIAAVGITGSGRERIGRMIGADAVRDEITAQAKAACRIFPDADTVFEIGGQDSKYIQLKNGQVVDFQMNKICAAGTGSFVEEQAARMDIPISEFGPLALTAKNPTPLGERCTVFIETAIVSAVAQGATREDIAAGLCHSIVRNYLHKVVGSKPVGQQIILQGGVCYNPGIVAAFQSHYGDRIKVSPYFSISGSYGAALLALEAIGEQKSQFAGFDFDSEIKESRSVNTEKQKNIAFYNVAKKAFLDGYDPTLDPKKKTVGIPYVLMLHKLFPMANAFFRSLGYNVILTTPTNEDTIRLSQQLAQGETCYPVKLIYGHMQQLIDLGVDYIFFPTIHTMRHETSRVANNYGCVYMQTAPRSIAKTLRLEEKGIELLSPVFDMDFGKQAMASAMLTLSKPLGKPKPLCAKALMSGAMAIRRHTEIVEKQGHDLLSSLKPDDKVLVLVTRNYGLSDPILNMGIPDLLLERGHKVITLSHLPAHDLDIHEEYANLYWPFGQHIVSGAKIIANHPNLYAVYLTNHGCGPDSMLSHLFRSEMGDKPYLQIEVDEHFSKVGVITRIEAFLNSLTARPAVDVPEGFNMQQVPIRTDALRPAPAENEHIYLPRIGLYSTYLADYLKRIYRADVEILPATPDALALGREETNAKEYLPFVALLGTVLEQTEKETPAGAFLIPMTEGSEADGLYAQTIKNILQRKNIDADIVAPILETLIEKAKDPDLLFRALLTGDLLYAAAPEDRKDLAPQTIPEMDDLIQLAAQISERSTDHNNPLGIVGTPLCMTEMDDGIFTRLEKDGHFLQRAPLAEYMWLLWHDQKTLSKVARKMLAEQKSDMQRLHNALGKRSAFSPDMSDIVQKADEMLPEFAGANGRYRFAKAMEMGTHTAGVLLAAPRYENTALIMDMREIRRHVTAPVFQLLFDGDWDETAEARLNSFLYYCKPQSRGSRISQAMTRFPKLNHRQTFPPVNHAQTTAQQPQS